MNTMQWFNEPQKWEKRDDSSLWMFVTPKTDSWRETHYGFTVDDAPFYYCNLGGEFEINVKVSGEFKSRFDQMGLMIRKDEKNWVKTGVEYIDGKINLSAVVTIEKSDWSLVELNENLNYIWLKITRKLDTIEIKFSSDNNLYKTLRLAYFPDNTPLMVGITAASPDGSGFNALFEDFEIKHLPDARRQKWLEEN